MKKFIYNLFYFTIVLFFIGELLVRIMHLVPDIPSRFIDEYGIQRYKFGQTGYYTGGKIKWKVNNYGWLGVSDLEKDTIISIVGDSYIENMMNPIECNQGSLLKKEMPKFSFFEAGRSGVTFIEALEISKILNNEIKPKYQLLYISNSDFYESISEINKFNDRVQISLNEKIIIKSKIKSSLLKNLLYNVKLLYYLYIKFPVFVTKQNKNDFETTKKILDKFDYDKFDKMFEFCKKNYNFKNLVLVFHPNTDERFIALSKKYNLNTIVLYSKNDSSWELNEKDKHWSCYGHKQVSNQVADNLNHIIKLTK